MAGGAAGGVAAGRGDVPAGGRRRAGRLRRRVETRVVLVVEPVLAERGELRVGVATLPDPLPLLRALLVVEERNEVIQRQTYKPGGAGCHAARKLVRCLCRDFIVRNYVWFLSMFIWNTSYPYQ